jgi:hypothetical protein
VTQQNGTGRRRGGGSARARPDLVVPGERREPEEGVELRARGSMEDVGAAVTVVPETGDVRPVGTISGGRKKSAGGAGRVSVNFRMDPAVHFAMKLLVFETGLDQQYLINLAIRQLCKEHGLDPDVIREGKGYTVSFPGSVGESG